MFKEIVVSRNHSWRNVAVEMERARMTARMLSWDDGDDRFLDDQVAG